MFTISLFHISLETWGAVFCLIAAFCVYYNYFTSNTEKRYLIELMLLGGLLLGSDAIAWYYRGMPGNSAYVLVNISNWLTFFATDLIVIVGSLYISYRIHRKKDVFRKDWYVHISITAALIDMTCLFLSSFTHWYYFIDEMNIYHRSYLSFMRPLCVAIALLVNLINLLYHRKNMSIQIFISLCLSSILPIFFSIYQYFNYGASYANIALIVSLINLFIVVMAEQGRELSKETKRINQMQNELLLSQIGPHFIYNTLGTIKHLCYTDPHKAAETVDYFSTYLRGNLESLTEDKLISFDDELKHVNAYLAVEKTRFADRLTVVTDIHEHDFLLPALTLQPIVENAVKHGVCATEEGGTVRIKEYSLLDSYIIKVIDNGAGFDVEKIKESADKHHVGMNNVKSRLKLLCNGTMDISSEIGIGTTVTITIPKERKMIKNEDYND